MSETAKEMAERILRPWCEWSAMGTLVPNDMMPEMKSLCALALAADAYVDDTTDPIKFSSLTVILGQLHAERILKTDIPPEPGEIPPLDGKPWPMEDGSGHENP